MNYEPGEHIDKWAKKAPQAAADFRRGVKHNNDLGPSRDAVVEAERIVREHQEKP